jgi:hypothetical protein
MKVSGKTESATDKEKSTTGRSRLAGH